MPGGIIVTARRRTETIESVPIAVTAFTAPEIASRSAANVADLANLVPNTVFNTTASLSGSADSASIFIRGIGQTDFVFSTDPGVAVYLDGVYIARATGSVLDLTDVERVEVLRGPQGTLFGRNTIGGAVSVITRQPELGETASGAIDAVLGTHGRREISGMANLPLSSKTAVRLVGSYRREGSYGQRFIDGKGLGGLSGVQIRGRLRWEPSERLRIDVSTDYADRNDESPVAFLSPIGPSTALGAPSTLFTGILYNNLINDSAGIAPCERPDFQIPFCGFPGLMQIPALPASTPHFDSRWLTGSPFTSFATGPTGSRFNGFGVTGTIEWDGFVKVRLISAWRHFDAEFGRDPDGTPLVMIETQNLLEHRQFSHELQLSHSDGPLTWTTGVHWFDETGTDRLTAPFVDETFRALRKLGLGCTLLPGATGGPSPVFLPDCPNIFRIDYAGEGTRVENRSVSAFAEGTFALNKWLSITGGLRWTHDRKRIDISGFLVGGLPVSPNPIAERAFSRLTPRIIVQVQPRPDLMIYSSFSTGFKSGGFNQRYGAPIAAPTSFAPEQVNTFEFGLRKRLLGDKGRVSLTGFWSNYSNIQAVVFDGGIPRTVNAAEGRSRGIELEGVFVPVRGLALTAGYGFLDAHFTRLDQAIIGSFGLPIVNPLRTSYNFVNSPRHSLTFSAEYRYDLGRRGAIMMRGDLSHRSSVANDAVNTPELIQGPTTLINAKLTYSPQGEHWSVSLFGTNLLNEINIVSGAADQAGFGAAEVNVSRPRRFGLSIGKKW